MVQNKFLQFELTEMSALSAGLLVGALDTVLDSNARVTPFRILLQVPGSQISWVIASGEWKQRVLFVSDLLRYLRAE